MEVIHEPVDPISAGVLQPVALPADPMTVHDQATVETDAATWSRAALMSLVAGRVVLHRDQSGEGRPVPSWLAESAAFALPTTRANWSIDLHPLDRAAAAGAFVEAVARPFELVTCTFRGRIGGELRSLDGTMLHLAGRHGLQVVSAFDDLGPVPDVDDWDALQADFVYDSAPLAIEFFDQLGVRRWIEGHVEDIYGRPAAELIDVPGLASFHPRHHGAVTALWVDLREDPDLIRSKRVELVRPDGTSRWAELTLINRLADPRIGAVVGLTHDITDQMAAEQAVLDQELALRRSHEEFAVLADRVPVAVFRADPDGTVTFANRHWWLLVGLDGPVEGHPTNLADIIDGDDHDALTDLLDRLARPDGTAVAALELRSRHGERTLELVCEAVGGHPDGGGRPIIGSMRDVTTANELRHQARHDDLTTLLNRPTLDDRLNEVLADNPANVLVAFIDLDGFKEVNDSFGHDVGDAVLRVVATRLRDAVRPSDDVGRYGGDEFVMICPHAFDGAEAAVTARIERALMAPIDVAGAVWQPAASIGLVRAAAGEDGRSVLRRADRSMYRTKQTRAS